jgi:catechol 2,3-dioxygenase-like lactoylglutathione lyase family enzyme
MSKSTFVLLYVDSPERSGAFYADLLGKAPVESSPGFVLFALDTGTMLGLWSRETVEPKAQPDVGGSELCLSADGPEDVDRTCATWRGRGVPILQEPTTTGFGRTFVGRDPDGHRLRVFAPPAAAAA